MIIRNLIWRCFSVLLVLSATPFAIAQSIADLEDPVVEYNPFATPTLSSEAKILTTEPNNIWTPEAPLIKTETRAVPLEDQGPSFPRNITYRIYSDGTQKIELENGDFLYFKVDSVMNQYSGEKEPNLNYRLTDKEECWKRTDTYFPHKRGILARRRYKNMLWTYYRISDNGPLMVKEAASHYTYTKEEYRKTIKVYYLLRGDVFGYEYENPGGSLKLKADGRTYEYDPKTGLYLSPDTPFGFELKDYFFLSGANFQDKKIIPNRQLVPFRGEMIACEVAPIDSITYLEDKTNYAIAHYANGDYVKYSLMKGKEWKPFEASLKRGNGLIGRFITEGNAIRGVVEFTSGPCKGYYMLAGRILTQYPIECEGTVFDSSFNTITYINKDGLTREQEAEGRAKIESRVYQTYCQKYGKQYVDALKNKKIIPGMPEALVKDVLYYSSWSSSSVGESCTVYVSSPHFSPIENKYTDYDPSAYTIFTSKYIVTFVNGKVSSVTFVS